ncbi:MAG: HAD-IIIC family phosphatase, partial [Pseudomonadota bacterium]|nr:HAD-IIIC family phosphatase [Pseudomonadota bacterium]
MNDSAQILEPVRLVIWDLDETFWRGTLSEGGIEAYIPAHHEIVVELARRGIMSSICSRNDFEAVRKVLQDKGLWNYFVFPSIDWGPKGARIARLIEAMQLRPESVLFLDDNPTNRAEAEAFAPGLRSAGDERIATMLFDPLLRGKDDARLTRLAQYKLLEQRKADEAAAPGGDNVAFLRSCDIRVSIDTDIERHLERAVELIQRTNQLNFTKLRLSEDPAEARRQLTEHISQYFVQAGLVRVRDRYGDYGFCGFFSKHNDNNDIRGR